MPIATQIHRMSMCRSYTIRLIGVTPTGRFRSHAANALGLARASAIRAAIPEHAARPGVLLCIFPSLRFTNFWRGCPQTDEVCGVHPWPHEAIAFRTGSSLEPLIYQTPVQTSLNRLRALRVAPFVKIDAARAVRGAARAPVSQHVDQRRGQQRTLGLGQKLAENHLVAV